VFNTMLMSVSERTREIGLLLALGWRRRTVMQLIFGEAVLLALAGGIVGIGLGLGLIWGLEHLEVMRGKIDAVVSLPFLLAALALSVVLGVGGSLYPALRAARLRPAQALRRE
jgi:putative ABC transport system permease protein